MILNYKDLKYILCLRVLGYFRVMISTDMYNTTFMFVMNLWYDIVYTTILCMLHFFHGIPIVWVYASQMPSSEGTYTSSPGVHVQVRGPCVE